MDQQQQQSQLKQLIAKGKEQGFLTYTEVNDHLPDSIVEPEQIEDIVRMINDMGILVHESAPDVDDQAITDAAVSTDEDAAEAAAAALASVDSEFGRTTDPVRMYMREMGTVELLTREGELKIAKRIEDGLNQVLVALSTYPGSVQSVNRLFQKVQDGEIRISDVISGFVDLDATDDFEATASAKVVEDTADKSETEESEAELDTGPDPELAAEKAALLAKHSKTLINSLKKSGKDHTKSRKAAENVSTTFLEFKFVPAVFARLVDNLRDTISRIRSQERIIMDLCVNKAYMPRKEFITSFPDNETNTDWVNEQIASGKSYAENLAELAPEIIRCQKRLLEIEQESCLTINEIKEINRRMSIGEAKARRAKKRDGGSQPATGYLDREEIHQPRPAVP
jgi:RNA polymerase primary sigma factor